MLTFSQRKKLGELYEDWCDEVGAKDCALSAAGFFSQFFDEDKVLAYLKQVKIKEEKTND